ncbi:MAG: DUF4031 domain-containing protein [Actinomycetota bacterium]|nr:DUF4031 domain-containing protein [Actinomycetota bacterium]
MTCYVDTVRSYPGKGLRFSEFCHLLADTPAELHAMADALGIPRRFYQDHLWRWHHDLPEHLRARAVELGAREITMHEVGALLRERRAALLTTSRRFDGCE